MQAQRFLSIFSTAFSLSFLLAVALNAAESPVIVTVDTQHPGTADGAGFFRVEF